MTGELLDIWGDPESISEVLEICRHEGIEVSAPLPRRPSSDALDAPISFDSIGDVAVVVTAVLNTGITATILTEKILAILAKKNLKKVSMKSVARKTTIK